MKCTFVTECAAIYEVIIIIVYMTLNSAAEVESLHLIILLQGLQQVQAVRAHLNLLLQNAPDRGLFHATLRK
jgi:hypothetical protein